MYILSRPYTNVPPPTPHRTNLLYITALHLPFPTPQHYSCTRLHHTNIFADIYSSEHHTVPELTVLYSIQYYTPQHCICPIDTVKGIVSRLQWIPRIDIKSTGLYTHIFKLFSRQFSCIKSWKAWRGWFSFDNNSANDVWQPQTDLLYQCCTSTKDSSIGMSLLRWPTRTLGQQLPDYSHYFKLFVIGQRLPPTWFIDMWTQITGDDLRLSLIIRRVTVKWETAKTCLLKIKHEEDVKNSYKCAPRAPSSSDLSFGKNYTHSQSWNTIPLTHSKVYLRHCLNVLSSETKVDWTVLVLQHSMDF